MSRVHYDFGNPEALEYMKNLIIGLLDDMECMFYRQDYNFGPAEGWARKDRTLDPDATYVIRNADTDETLESDGATLMEYGLTVNFPRTMVSHMIYFDKK